MPITDPAADLVDHLDTEVGSLTKGTNLFAGKMREKGANTPSSVVFLLNTPGRQPITYTGGGGLTSLGSGIQALIRSDNDAFETGQALAYTVLHNLHAQDVTGYADIIADSCAPTYVGEIADRHHLWSINFEVEYEETF